MDKKEKEQTSTLNFCIRASLEPHRVQCPECVSHFATQGCGQSIAQRILKTERKELFL